MSFLPYLSDFLANNQKKLEVAKLEKYDEGGDFSPKNVFIILMYILVINCKYYIKLNT